MDKQRKEILRHTIKKQMVLFERWYDTLNPEHEYYEISKYLSIKFTQEFEDETFEEINLLDTIVYLLGWPKKGEWYKHYWDDEPQISRMNFEWLECLFFETVCSDDDHVDKILEQLLEEEYTIPSEEEIKKEKIEEQERIKRRVERKNA